MMVFQCIQHLLISSQKNMHNYKLTQPALHCSSWFVYGILYVQICIYVLCFPRFLMYYQKKKKKKKKKKTHLEKSIDVVSDSGVVPDVPLGSVSPAAGVGITAVCNSWGGGGRKKKGGGGNKKRGRGVKQKKKKKTCTKWRCLPLSM